LALVIYVGVTAMGLERARSSTGGGILG